MNFDLEQEIDRYKTELALQKMALDQFAIVAITDAKGTINYVNDKFCELSKFSRDELIGQNHRLVNSGYHAKEFFTDMWKTIASEKVWQGEIKNKCKDGSYYWVDTTIVPFTRNNKAPHQYVSIRYDITSRKEAEERLELERTRLVNSEKMASLGIMAAGIAHEIGNPLAALRGRLELLSTSNVAENPTVIKTVDSGLLLVDRINRIIKGLKAYARDGSADPFEKIDICELARDILEFVKVKSEQSGIKLLFECGGDRLRIQCRESEIGQVLVNLVNNAFDAIQDLDEKWIKVRVIEKDNTILIEVIDSGSGIDSNVVRSMFDPFFTTKPPGSGTGLGLSISNNIIRSHQGTLSVDQNNPNTCFCIELPKAQ